MYWTQFRANISYELRVSLFKASHGGVIA
jgi:hypothetical protein